MALVRFFANLLSLFILEAQQCYARMNEAVLKPTEEQLIQQAREIFEWLKYLSGINSSFLVPLRQPRQPVISWEDLIVAAVLVLLLGLYWWTRRRSPDTDDSSSEESSGSDTHCQEVESDGETVEERHHALIYERCIQWTVLSLCYTSSTVQELLGDLLHLLQGHLANSSSPELQPAIGVGSAFEGWNPCDSDVTYRMLVPLKAPHGYSFHLEPDFAQELPGKNFCVRVSPECTCSAEEPAGDAPCFLHYPEEPWRRNQGPSVLDTLCTGPYLDVHKTALWFQNLVTSAWGELPQSRRYRMQLQLSRHSCKLKLSNASRGPLFVKLLFGVQQGDSDIFVSSQTAAGFFTPSTTWPETCAVAEAKFFRHVARNAPPGSYHLNCLQLCARMVPGTGFSTYIIKTVVMHLLTTTPLSDWRRRYLLPRLKEIMQYLRRRVEEKRLNHFFFGNHNVPEEIVLPPAFREAEPINLFHYLTDDTAAHAEALRDCEQLQDRLTRRLFREDERGLEAES
ncbi:inositol 1,4,5-trisphosphate receptor-interacting protein-like 1 [Colius striatus]|uniref:inositol 1,4,5-trisphosphate receptor-interacting protein-like 1 n=1 Tax=Colius striatus TaxID=57412 RepID=UPI002B1D89AE|nr:inositol 1,4,5-trisphosphate receptor-interacting protein-like 1 [Colius striatus]